MDSLELQLNLWRNIALVSIAVFVYGFFLHKLEPFDVKFRSLITGILFGSVGLLGMLAPVEVGPGIIVDGRVIITGLSGFFSGGPAALMCTLMVVLYRFYLGGQGVWAGVGAISTAGLVGVLFWRARARRESSISTFHLLFLGLCLSFQALLWTFTLPWNVAWPIFKTYLVPIPISYVLGTLLCGHLFLFETRRLKMEQHLKEAKIKAEEASHHKSLFLANVSHEIRTPLNGIVGAAEVLSLTELSDDQRRMVGILNRGSSILLSLISDLLDLSRIEAGVVVVENKLVSFPELIKGIVELFSLQAEKKGLALKYKISPILDNKVFADEQKLLQSLTNLVGNAIKFTESGMVSIELSAENISTHDVSVRFTVLDTGPGIANIHHEKIFKPFQQGDISTTKKHEGMGLGLAIAQQFVQAMGGQLELKNGIPHGTQFSFTLTLQWAQKPRSAS